MPGIPYFDPADEKPLGVLSESKAERYLAEGKARAVYNKHGRLRKLYRLPRERAYGSAQSAFVALHGSASLTTHRVRNDAGTLIAPPWTRAHKEVRDA